MTLWSDIWLVVLAAFAAAVAILEIIAVILGGGASTYTLSDTIRRWAKARTWIAPIAIGLAAGLSWHLFGVHN